MESSNISLNSTWQQIGGAGMRASVSSPTLGVEYCFAALQPDDSFRGHYTRSSPEQMDLSASGLKLWARSASQGAVLVVSEF